MEQKIALVSEYLSTAASTGNLSIMFLDDGIDPAQICIKHPELTEVQIVDKTYKGNAVVDMYLKMRPNVVFVDLKKLENDGIYALGKIRELNPSVKIISV